MRRAPAAIHAAAGVSGLLAAVVAYELAHQVAHTARLWEQGVAAQPGAPVATLLCVLLAAFAATCVLGAVRLVRRGEPALTFAPLVLVAIFGVQGVLRLLAGGNAALVDTRMVLFVVSPFVLIAVQTALCLTPGARRWVGSRAGTRTFVRRVG